MSKAFEMISESLNEIIQDLEENGGKNLKREILSVEIPAPEKLSAENKFYTQNLNEKSVAMVL